MADLDRWTEPGRSLSGNGRIVYDWPPAGRFREVWERFDRAFSDEEKDDLLALLGSWRDEGSTLVAYMDVNGMEADGEWVDVEPNWSVPEEWKDAQ